MLKLRFVSWNVYQFYNSKGSDMGKVLAELKPDVVALQEASFSKTDKKRDLEDLAQTLGANVQKVNAIFDLHNCIVSSLKCLQQEDLYIDVDHFERRSLVVSKLQLPTTKSNYSLNVASLHLDVMSESTRLKQIEKVLQFLNHLNPFYILMGDFNSLHREDYSDEYWDEINRIRIQNHLEPSNSSVMKKIIDELGHLDCGYHFNDGQFKAQKTVWAGTRLN